MRGNGDEAADHALMAILVRRREVEHAGSFD
jgi:hypothetical protein